MVKKLIIIIALVMSNTVVMADVTSDMKALEDGAKALLDENGKITDINGLQNLINSALDAGLKDINLVSALSDAGVNVNDIIVSMSNTTNVSNSRLADMILVIVHDAGQKTDAERAAISEEMKTAFRNAGKSESEIADAGQRAIDARNYVSKSSWLRHQTSYRSSNRAFGYSIAAVSGSPLRVDPVTGGLQVSPS